MRRLTAILLIAVFGFSTVFKLGLVAKYCVNFEYYAKVLCINQDKPEMACNGKCHLKKELKQADNSGNENIPEMAYKLQLSVFVVNDNCFSYLGPTIINRAMYNYCPNLEQDLLCGYHSIVFRPPIV